MARTTGMLNLSGNLEVKAGAPLDARTVVPTAADLLVASNFQYKYVGMPVVVQATGDMYILTANDVTVAANWKPVGKTYTAGTNVNISDQNVISATDTTYTAGDGIVIDNDEISTDNMPAADMSEIVTPLPSVMSRFPRYSTEEQVVAYWIDGKPVYQKTVDFGKLPNNTTKSVSHGVTNISKIVDVKAIGITATLGLPIPMITLANTDIGFWVSTTEVTIKTQNDRSAIDGYVTFRYTKTTD